VESLNAAPVWLKSNPSGLLETKCGKVTAALFEVLISGKPLARSSGFAAAGEESKEWLRSAGTAEGREVGAGSLVFCRRP